MTKPIILRAAKLPAATLAELEHLFTVLHLPEDKADVLAFLKQHGASVRGLALRKTVVDQTMLEALPALEIIASYSAGLDNVDLDAVRARGIQVRNSSQILARDVANTAMALLLAVTRDIVSADAFVRDGSWARGNTFPLGRSIVGMKVGVVGLGAIGSEVALRLQALGAVVAYTGPRPKAVDLAFHATVHELAEVSDALVLTCPLTNATHHAVDAAVLQALGPRGYLINISRGPVVDEEALIGALAQGRIAGAGLDVFELEPAVPQELIEDPRVILTPHIGSGTEETRQAMADNVVEALADHFQLRPLRQEDAVRGLD
ncbi:MAG: 2-hydroxyacid dehydrogenase [Alphaproteobacteria bacterium]|nr:2-hydroxyacid dehydrogenase [Alphaproteobacteria bacterium]